MCLRIERTVSVPKVKLGTNLPSMTSTWIRSAPLPSSARTAAASSLKSAARRLGARWMASLQGAQRGIRR